MLRKNPPGAARRHRTTLALTGLLCVATLLPGRTITVDDDDPSADYSSIQPAIDAAVAGDLVSVAPGVYAENLNLKSGVSVIGAGADVTTVDAGARLHVALLLNCDATTLLQGFTLTNGQRVSGAGVYVLGGAPIIDSNRIVGNTAVRAFDFSEGGGILLQNTRAVVSNNLISNNSADFGAGIEVGSGASIITRNRITGNAATISGGGLHFYNSFGAAVNGNSILLNSTTGYGGGVGVFEGAPIISNNLITGNTAISTDPNYGAYGGGVHVFNSNARLINNTLADNKADVGGGVSFLAFGSRHPGLINNILYRNTGTTDSGGADLVVTEADILNNIFFANSLNDCGGVAAALCMDPTNLLQDPSLVDASRADYRLLAASPAIDSGVAAGAPTDDLRGQRRPLDGNGDRVAAVDRGAYEYDRDDIFGLRFSTATTLTWQPASGAALYHVYSGALSTLATRGTDTCRDADDLLDLSDLLFTETRSPLAGGGFAYVVTAVIGGTEQSPGFDSRGLERSLLSPCP